LPFGSQTQFFVALLKLQDTQLSQRDRAAGCVIVFAKSRRLHGRQYFTDLIGPSSTTVIIIIGVKICRILGIDMTYLQDVRGI